MGQVGLRSQLPWQAGSRGISCLLGPCHSPFAPLGFLHIFAIERAFWPGLLGSDVSSSTESKEKWPLLNCLSFLIHAVRIIISTDAKSRRWVVGEMAHPGSGSSPHASSLGQPADPVDDLLEPSIQKLQTQLLIALENQGTLLASG